jgi:hypothetical protein
MDEKFRLSVVEASPGRLTKTKIVEKSSTENLQSKIAKGIDKELIPRRQNRRRKLENEPKEYIDMMGKTEKR